MDHDAEESNVTIKEVLNKRCQLLFTGVSMQRVLQKEPESVRKKSTIN